MPAPKPSRSLSLLKLSALIARFIVVLLIEAIGGKVASAIVVQILYHGSYDSRLYPSFINNCQK
jgi:hypothetical protein